MTSRARYLAYYEQAVRANAIVVPAPVPSAARIKKDGLKAWNSLTVARRLQFISRLNVLSTACVVRDDFLDTADRRANRAFDAVDFGSIVQTAERAAWAHEPLLDRPHPEPDTPPIRGWQQKVVNAAIRLRNAVGNAANAAPNATLTALHGQLQTYAAREVVTERATLQTYRNRRTGWQFTADNPPVPARPADGVIKMPEIWLSERRKAILQRNWQTNFQRAPLPPNNANFTSPNDNWRAMWPLGKGGGGQGAAGLWISSNGGGFVNNRVLKKSTKLDAEQWASVTTMDGDVRNAGNREPLEITCQRAMGTVLGRSTQQALVPTISAAIPESDRFTYDIFMEYCPSGDLSALIYHYTINELGIPEPFIWYVLLTLSEAGLAMQCGHQTVIGNPPGRPATAGPGWLPDEYGRDNWQLVHRDIKPLNVFLGLPVNTHFANYPTPKLGDFGLALKTWTPNPNNPPAAVIDGLNPHIFLGAGTPGFRAPEMRAYVNQQTSLPIDRTPLDSKTNVWGVGMVIHCLICQDIRPDQADWVGNPLADMPNTRANEKVPYSDELHRLVAWCLQPDPINRPTFRQLIRDVEICIREGAGQPDLAEGMRQHGPGAGNPFNRLNLPNDKYAIGLAHANL